MNKELLSIMKCPVCPSSELDINIIEETDEIIEGDLICNKCGESYPIHEAIPRMIPKNSSLYKEMDLEVRNANIEVHDKVASIYDGAEENRLLETEYNQNRFEANINNAAKECGNDYFLDAGCGTGNLLKFGKKYFNHAIGFDVSVNMLKIARAKGFDVVQADLYYLPFKSNTFNLLTICSVLHHAVDYQKAIIELARTVRSKGILYTDWDPNQIPKLNFPFGNIVSFFVRNVLKVIAYSVINTFITDKLKSTYSTGGDLTEKAEFHERSKENRGLDCDFVVSTLRNEGFSEISPKFHWAGFDKNELLKRSKFRVFAKIFISFAELVKIEVNKFMENLQIIARKA